ncbi:B3 domain-containing transcription repressor VAL1-like isoform X2 [Silene latifolia]|uniref:B3 domain-containing transcription repressor VAL1-like isoform X2 n=1 Tax=Silene latifolia TaxID=37657 RepID=UPI003D786DF5
MLKKVGGESVVCATSASASFLEIQDFGGVWCTTCARSAASHSVMRDGISCKGQTLTKNNNTCGLQNSQITSKPDSVNLGNGSILALGNIVQNNGLSYLPHPHTDLMDGICGQPKLEASCPQQALGLGFPDDSYGLNGPAVCAPANEDKNNTVVKDIRGPQIPSLNINLQSPSKTSNFAISFLSGVEDGDKSRPALCQSGQKPRHILPKPPKSNPSKGVDASKVPYTPMRVARPPAEGRLKNQLLPRYWPRITDQELQKLSGELNSTIVPLFEKILSASDASRIGRLVLPKACAETYFPSINHSEGLPLKVQDVKGNEWTFQFRFWPNNNSRMYVLEGVTPCIQAMELQAGDTVTFSRIDPGGKLVIGYRKASNALEIQETQTSLVNPNGVPSGESLCHDVTDGLATDNGPSGLHLTRDLENHLTFLPEQLETLNGDTVLNKYEKLSMASKDASQQPNLAPLKKRMRDISSKSKRSIMHNEDAVEIRLSWEDTQDLLRPPPNAEPNIVLVEDIEFEEYNEPPVFGKRTYFTAARLSGVQEQWAQCDNCSKWRKLPADVRLPPKWTCSSNIWDLSRSSCDTLEEMSSKELESVFRFKKDFKKQKVLESPESFIRYESSGLDALATAATLGDHAEPSAGATTRHPRHRPGCSCIVCIQPPSGKGKHKSSCVCNVCLTVKRRFKTLMMRKKKRQCERDAELAKQKSHDRPIKGSPPVKNPSTDGVIVDEVCPKNDILVKKQSVGESCSKDGIDLNCHPIREDGSKGVVQPSKASTSPAQTAKDPSDIYMNPNELGNLLQKQPTNNDSSHQEANDVCPL